VELQTLGERSRQFPIYNGSDVEGARVNKDIVPRKIIVTKREFLLITTHLLCPVAGCVSARDPTWREHRETAFHTMYPLYGAVTPEAEVGQMSSLTDPLVLSQWRHRLL